MSEKKEDLRIQRTKEAIHTVFKEMVCEMPYEKITVKAIADRAKINRNTFYLHYETTDDVLREIQVDYSSRYIELIKNYDYTKHTAELVRSFFEYMESQDEFFKKITCDSRFDYIREKMQNRVASMTQANSGKLKSHSEAIQNIVRTFNNTVLYLYRQWVADGRKIPMEEMIELATTLIEKGVKGFFGS